MLKRLFVPCRANNYHPYILRPVGTGLVVVLILLQPLIYNLVSAHRFQLVDYATDITPAQLLNLTNQQRQSAGVPALRDNSRLDQAAKAKAADMFAKDYWAHDSPTGETPWTFIANAGYRYSAAAENLAMDFSTSGGVITGWMGSTEHRLNMLNGTYTDVGFGIMNGTLKGEQTTLVVAMYGAPAAVPAAATASSPTSAQPGQPAAGQPASLSLVSKIEHVGSLNWGQRATIFLLLALLLANLLKHTVVWRKQKRGWKHIWLRSHPAFQSCLLAVALLAVIFSSYGVIT